MAGSQTTGRDKGGTLEMEKKLKASFLICHPLPLRSSHSLMAHPLRIQYPRAWHHVNSRGNERIGPLCPVAASSEPPDAKQNFSLRGYVYAFTGRRSALIYAL